MAECKHIHIEGYNYDAVFKFQVGMGRSTPVLIDTDTSSVVSIVVARCLRTNNYYKIVLN